MRVLAHIEEVVLATSGEDAFELVFALAAARITGDPPSRVRKRRPKSFKLMNQPRAKLREKLYQQSGTG